VNDKMSKVVYLCITEHFYHWARSKALSDINPELFAENSVKLVAGFVWQFRNINLVTEIQIHWATESQLLYLRALEKYR
jgi:hypothetical protein